MRRIAVIGLPQRDYADAVLRRLSECGYGVLSVTTYRPASTQHPPHAARQVRSYALAEVLPAVAEYHGRYPLSGVLLFNEMTVEVSTLVAAELGLPHLPVDRISACVNKLEMRRWMRERGVPHPEFAEVGGLDEALDAASRLGYPLVVKPQIGGGSYGVTRVDDDRDMRRFFDHLDIFWEPRSFVVERYLEGHEVSLETVIGSTGHTHVAVFDKPQQLTGPFFLETVYVTPPGLPAQTVSAIQAAGDELVGRLGLRRCITHTELRLTSEGPVVVEFAVRPNGWPAPPCVTWATGVDLIEVAAGIACGDEPTVRVRRSEGCYGFRFLRSDRVGVVDAVPDVAAADTVPGFRGAGVWVRPGDRLGVPPADFNYRHGYLMMAGDTCHEVVQRLALGAARLKIDVEEGASVQRTGDC